jgi:hypothetical protein
MAFCCCGEGRSACAGSQGDNFTTPTEADHAPGLDGWVLGGKFFDKSGDFLGGRWGSAGGLEEVS